MAAFQELLSTLAGTRGLFHKFVVGQGLRTEGELFSALRSTFDQSLTSVEAQRIASQLSRAVDAGSLMSAGEILSPLDIPITSGLMSPGRQRAPFMASAAVTVEIELPDGSITTITRPVIVSGDSLMSPGDIAAKAAADIIADREERYQEIVDEDSITVEIEWAFRTFQ